MAAPELRITDHGELIALHRALLEAKFHPDPNDRDVAASPLVARIARSVVDALIESEVARNGGRSRKRWNQWLAIDPERREWKIALRHALGAAIWDRWDRDGKLEHASVLLAPFHPTPARLERFVLEVDERVTAVMASVHAATQGGPSEGHALAEASDEDLEVLMSRYRTEADASARAVIVEVVGQRRRQEDLYFLLSALDDESAEVWVQVLNGLVTLGTPAARSELDSFLRNLPAEDDRRCRVEDALSRIGGDDDAS